MDVVAAAVFAGALALIALEWVHRTKVALLGAVLMVLVGVLDQEHAIASVDWATLGLLTGMMVIVGLTERTGVFTFIALRVAQLSVGSSFRLVFLLGATTAVLSAFLDNLTAILLVTVGVIVRATDSGGLYAQATLNITVNATEAMLHFIHVDHLNTPRLIANQSGQTVWRWDQQEPFGNSAPDENPSRLGTFDFPQRFPGQYFDKETQLHYNYFRDYDATIGRYGQSDPIGLRGGLNTYAYVASDPLAWRDPLGLDVLVCQRPLGGIWGGFNRGMYSSYDSYIPSLMNPLYHQYLCVGEGSDFKCGGQGTTGGIIAPGRPSEDDYPYNRPDLCKPIQATKCVERCVLRKLASSQRPFYVLLYSDCQRWSKKVLKECKEECKDNE